MINTLVAVVMAMSTVALPEADSPPPGAVTVEVVTVNGSGCRPGTAAVAPSPDNATLHVLYSDYLAAVGAGTRPTDYRKNCQLNLRVNVSQDFTFAIGQIDYRGFAHLERGATGTQRGTYYFAGMPQVTNKSHTWQGPLDDNWQATDTIDIPFYRPCGVPGNLNINTELRVSAGTSDPKTTSYMAMDSTDAYIATVYHLVWKRCP